MSTLDIRDIRWRVSNTWDKGGVKWGMLVGYIDSRTAMDALDALDPNWSSHMEPVALNGEHGVRCTLTVNGVSREDVGIPSNIDALKGAFSDALKRAAVHFGIGRELYELPKIAVECDVLSNGKVKGPKATPEYKDGRWTIDNKYGWVRYDREPEPIDESGRAGSTEAQPRQPVPTDPNAISDATIRTRYLWAERRGWSDDVLDAASIAALGKTPMELDSLDWQLFAATIKDGPTEKAAEDSPSVAEPEAGAGTPAPAEPPQRGTEEYGALDARAKAQARSYWATKALEERKPEPMNAEQTVLPVEAA